MGNDSNAAEGTSRVRVPGQRAADAGPDAGEEAGRLAVSPDPQYAPALPHAARSADPGGKSEGRTRVPESQGCDGVDVSSHASVPSGAWPR